MYDFLALKVKCPVCNESLMDSKQLVDNEPSIKLNIEASGKKDVIRLSSIYGSYSRSSTLSIADDEIVIFSCPHCAAVISDETNCLSCEAPMVPFYLDMGGKVSVCSRNGCQNHKVEFNDLSIALKKLYQDYGLAGNHEEEADRVIKAKDNETIDETTEILKSGTFLQAYCPHCKKTLIENDQLKLKIKNGAEGFLLLSPYLNVFTSKSTIFLPEDKLINDIMCFHCNHSLINKEEKCGKCGSTTAKISLGARTKLLDFYMCTKKGCRWHGLSKDDYYDIRLEDSLEW